MTCLSLPFYTGQTHGSVTIRKVFLYYNTSLINEQKDCDLKLKLCFEHT